MVPMSKKTTLSISYVFANAPTARNAAVKNTVNFFIRVFRGTDATVKFFLTNFLTAIPQVACRSLCSLVGCTGSAEM